MDLVPGVVIAGRYRVERRIGAGAMGEVWGGTHQAVGSKVAIKRLLTGGATNPEVVARFRREAVLLGRVRSDYVSRVLDFVEDPALGLVLVMELIEGDSLYDVLLKRRFSVEEAVALGCDVLASLCDLHDAQIVHRDLKPGNIIMETRKRGGPRAVLVDFGMSRVVAGSSDEEEMTGITRADVALGTLEYMAPEQILNSRGVSASADIYAAGAMLYRSITGQHAYAGGTESALARAKLMQEAPPLQTGRDDAISQGFTTALARALRRKPSERYQTPQEMLVELHRLRDLARGERSVAAGAATSADLRRAATIAMTLPVPPPPPPPPSSARAPSSESMERKAASLAPPEESTGSGFVWGIIVVAIVGGVAAFMAVRNPAIFQQLKGRVMPAVSAPATAPAPPPSATVATTTTAADLPPPAPTSTIPSTSPEPPRSVGKGGPAGAKPPPAPPPVKPPPAPPPVKPATTAPPPTKPPAGPAPASTESLGF